MPNRYPIRGKQALIRNFLATVAGGSTVTLSSDQAAADILALGSSTITNGMPGALTLTGNVILQFPNVAGDATHTGDQSDGQFWFLDLSVINYVTNSKTITVKGFQVDGVTPTTGIAIPGATGTTAHHVLLYWNGTEMAAMFNSPVL